MQHKVYLTACEADAQRIADTLASVFTEYEFGTDGRHVTTSHASDVAWLGRVAHECQEIIGLFKEQSDGKND